MNNDIKTVWIGFKSASFFIKRFMKKDFSHMYVLTRDEHSWIYVDPCNEALGITILPYERNKNVPFYLKKEYGDRLIKVQFKIKDRNRPNLNPFLMINCVNIVKYMMGISVFVFTPYGLYKYFTKMQKNNCYKNNILKVEIV